MRLILAMISCSANSVVVNDSDDEFILVGFAVEADGKHRDAMHFQRPYEFDEQDIELGMDDVSIKRGIQSGSCYGGIDSVILSRNRKHIHLSGNSAQSLGEDHFTMSFAIPDSEFERLAPGLQDIFEGQSTQTENENAVNHGFPG